MRPGILSSLVIINVLLPSAHANSFTDIGIGYQYSTGSYGQDTDTIIESIPLSFSYSNNAWNLQLGITYLEIQGNGSAIPGANGTIISNNIGITASPSGSTSFGPPSTSTSTSSDIVSESGTGDAHISLGYTFIPTDADAMLLTLSSHIKLATADPAKNLGTGENDYSMQLDGYYNNRGFTPFYSIGYTLTGDTEEITYNDTGYASVGFTFPATENTRCTVAYDYRSSSTDETESFQQISLAFDWKSSTRWSANITMLTGLTEASPDTGFGIGLRRYF